MSYMNSAINNSPTIIDKAAKALTKPAMLAMVYENGALAIASSAGAPAIGIAIAETDDNVEKGGDVSVVIKDITFWRAGAAIAKGAEVMTDVQGKAVPATAGKFVVGIALDEASAVDDIIHVQIVKAGYKA